MKWYKRDPDAFYAGTRGLSLEEIGAYSIILDVLYSRDGEAPGPDDNEFWLSYLGCHGNTWNAVKKSLLAKGKIWETAGKMSAKRVEKALKEAANFSEIQRKRSNYRWKSTEPPSQDGNPITTTPTPTPTEKKERERAPRAARERGSRLTEDWTPSPRDLLFAHSLLSSDQVDFQAAQFRDYWLGRAGQAGCKLDWAATWRKWIRKTAEDTKHAAPTSDFRATARQLRDYAESDGDVHFPALRAVSLYEAGGN